MQNGLECTFKLGALVYFVIGPPLRPVPDRKGHGILFIKGMESHEKSWNLRAKILCEPC